jgi:hypothetical protein
MLGSRRLVAFYEVYGTTVFWTSLALYRVPNCRFSGTTNYCKYVILFFSEFWLILCILVGEKKDTWGTRLFYLFVVVNVLVCIGIHKLMSINANYVYIIFINSLFGPE